MIAASATDAVHKLIAEAKKVAPASSSSSAFQTISRSNWAA